jgi:CHAD domain-containing protein
MDANELIRYYRKRSGSFIRHLKRSGRSLGEEDIHKLRTDIKKLRLYLSLIRIVSKKEFDKTAHFILFNELFDHAGALREIHVNLGLLKKYDTSLTLPFRKSLLARKNSTMKSLGKVLSQFDTSRLKEMDKEISRHMTSVSNEMILERSTGFVEKKMERIRGLQKAPVDDKKLHKIRIYLKEISEIKVVIKAIYPDAPVIRSLFDIDDLAKRIGNWHDRVILMETLRQYNKTGKAGILLNELIISIERKVKDEKENIIARLAMGEIRKPDK